MTSESSRYQGLLTTDLMQASMDLEVLAHDPKFNLVLDTYATERTNVVVASPESPVRLRSSDIPEQLLSAGIPARAFLQSVEVRQTILPGSPSDPPQYISSNLEVSDTTYQLTIGEQAKVEYTTLSGNEVSYSITPQVGMQFLASLALPSLRGRHTSPVPALQGIKQLTAQDISLMMPILAGYLEGRFTKQTHSTLPLNDKELFIKMTETETPRTSGISVEYLLADIALGKATEAISIQRQTTHPKSSDDRYAARRPIDFELLADVDPSMEHRVTTFDSTNLGYDTISVPIMAIVNHYLALIEPDLSLED